MRSILAVVGVMAVVATSIGVAFSPMRAESTAFWVVAIAPTVVLAIVGCIRAARDGELGEWLRPKWGDFSLAALTAALLFGGAYLFSHTIAAVGTPREAWLAKLYLQLGSSDSLRQHMTSLSLALITAAAAEEIVWRGMVTSLFAEAIGSRRAWIASAAAYGLANLPAAWTLRDPVAGLNPVLPLAGLGAGLVWGALTRTTGRLVPSILAHALFSWSVVMTFRLWGTSL